MPKLHEEVIRPEDLRLIRSLPAEVFEPFYLAGGTALALRIGHRYSHDFDFFTGKPFRNDRIKSALGKSGSFQLFQESAGTLEGGVGETRLTFLYYDYPLLGETEVFHSVRIASLPDIAVMKLSAVSGRGGRKDFVDLFFLKDVYDWAQLLAWFEEKYRGAGFNLYHMIKSLGYFEDAEKDPMPDMIRPCGWNEIVEYFKTMERELSEKYC